MIPFKEEGFCSTEKAFSFPTMNLSLLIVTGGFSQTRMRKLWPWLNVLHLTKEVGHSRAYLCNELTFVDFEKWSIYHRPDNGWYLVSSFFFLTSSSEWRDTRKLCSFSQGGVLPSETLACLLDGWCLFNSSLRKRGTWARKALANERKSARYLALELSCKLRTRKGAKKGSNQVGTLKESFESGQAGQECAFWSYSFDSQLILKKKKRGRHTNSTTK